MPADRQHSVSATEFVRNFPRYKDRALSGEIITVKSHSRIVGGYLSPQDLEHYERLKQRERRVLSTRDLPDDIIEEIRKARYGKPPE